MPRDIQPVAKEQTMKTMWIPITATALSLALVVGCKERNNREPTVTETITAQPAGTTTTTSATPLSKDDKEFITKAAEGGMLEVELGKQVSQKALSPDVKAFGARMVTDHSKANAELGQIATTKGVALPTELDKDHQKVVVDITKLTGKKLDKAYAKDMVKDHEEDVKEFRKASADLKDPDLRVWAAKTLTVLEQHLTMAKDVNAKVKHE
jgi:putative membrane protein